MSKQLKGRQHRPRTQNSNRFITKSEVKGGKVTPPSNPPDITAQPWYPYVIVDTFKGSVTYSASDICKYFKERIDPTNHGLNAKSDFRLQLRVVAINVWNLTGRFITLSVEDYTDSIAGSEGRDQLCGLLDSGTQLHTPAVGYKIPLGVRTHTLRNDDKQGGIQIFHSQAGTSDACLAHIHILWRFDGPITPPSLNIPGIGDIETGLSGLTDIGNTLKKIAETNEQSKPSTVSKVVDGVSRLALLVATSAIDDDISFLSDLDQCIGHFDIDLPADPVDAKTSLPK